MSSCDEIGDARRHQRREAGFERIEGVVEIEQPGIDVAQIGALIDHQAHAHTRVPAPCSVKSSTSRACGTPAVENDHRLDAGLNRGDGGLELGDHAAAGHAGGDRLAGLAHRQLADQASLAIQNPRHIGEQQHALGLERARRGRRPRCRR